MVLIFEFACGISMAVSASARSQKTSVKEFTQSVIFHGIVPRPVATAVLRVNGWEHGRAAPNIDSHPHGPLFERKLVDAT
jgi:hypothetical protein